MTGVTRRALVSSAAVAAAGFALPADAATPADNELAQLLSQPRVLLKRAIVLTLDPAVGDFAAGDVLIDNGKIAQIAPNIDASPDSTFIADMTNRIIIPGFVDTHSHSYQGLLR